MSQESDERSGEQMEWKVQSFCGKRCRSKGLRVNKGHFGHYTGDPSMFVNQSSAARFARFGDTLVVFNRRGVCRALLFAFSWTRKLCASVAILGNQVSSNNFDSRKVIFLFLLFPPSSPYLIDDSHDSRILSYWRQRIFFADWKTDAHSQLTWVKVSSNPKAFAQNATGNAVLRKNNLLSTGLKMFSQKVIAKTLCTLCLQNVMLFVV